MGVVMLVRHGQGSFASDDYDVLSRHGVRQCRRLGETLSRFGVRPKAVIHGDLRRQRESAAEILQAAPTWEVSPTTDPRWDEFDHLAVINAYPTLSDEDRADLAQGRMDGRDAQAIFTKATARWAAGAHDEDYPESFPDFLRRVREAIGEAARAAGPKRTAVVVTSGGPIAAACAILTQTGEDPQRLSGTWQRFQATIVNASVTRVVFGSSGARLLTFNEHSHLDRDLVTYR